ncbi:MAG: diguanylate cyclase (GGDEF)-like protein [Gammaproteobacteria bacterium]|jgi:diguanylate cyclase (GGDEF)-like protein
MGAEFALLLPDCSCDNARLMARRIEKTLIDRKIRHEATRIGQWLTLSIGIACQNQVRNSSSRALLSSFERSLKMAKEKGHNRIEIIEG